LSGSWTDTDARGFTLLEMTVVLLLVALMSTLMMHGLRFGARAYSQVVKVDDANWDIYVAQRFLRSTLESAYPFDPARAADKAYGLEGTARHLSFSAALGRSTAPGALRRYELVIAPDAHAALQRNVLIRWRFDRDGRPSAAGTPQHQEVLIEDIAQAEWSYASCGASSEQDQWQDTWQGHRELPALVRLRIVFPKDDRRQWPELIVAPRVTDDAMSWFDDPAAAASACERLP
jgi:prepilin-type N-terminal cleavage/methylation domain-containing protein